MAQTLPLLEPNTEASLAMSVLLIPDYDPEDPQPYPGNIQPGEYQGNEIVELLRQHADNPEAVRFIADLLKE
jgi:hypothetical protein